MAQNADCIGIREDWQTRGCQRIREIWGGIESNYDGFGGDGSNNDRRSPRKGAAMTLSEFMSRTFSTNSSKRRDQLDREINAHKATIRETAQIMESGSRIIETYANAMKLMVENDHDE